MVCGNHRHLNNINIGDLSPFTKLGIVGILLKGVCDQGN
jgi:hypothetical protein